MKTLVLSILFLLLTWAASAQRNSNGPVRNNIRLTDELFRLRNEQLRLHIMRQRLLEDGRLTRREMAEIRKARNQIRKPSVKKRSRRHAA